MAPQARPQLAIASQPQLVACLAEMEVRHRTDKTNALREILKPVIDGWAVCSEFRFGDQRAEITFDDPAGFCGWEKIVLAQNVRSTHGHQLDESHQKVLLSRIADECRELALVPVSHKHSVQFDCLKSGGLCGL